MKSNKRKITVRFSKRLKNEMQQSIIDSHYGLRGKSRWLSDAISLFLKQNNYIELVEHGIDINQANLEIIEAFYLNDEMLRHIHKAFISVRARYPLFEGVQSAFIRACIIYRLMVNK